MRSNYNRDFQIRAGGEYYWHRATVNFQSTVTSTGVALMLNRKAKGEALLGEAEDRGYL